LKYVIKKDINNKKIKKKHFVSLFFSFLFSRELAEISATGEARSYLQKEMTPESIWNRKKKTILHFLVLIGVEPFKTF